MAPIPWLCSVLLHLNVISAPGSYSNCEIYDYERTYRAQIQSISSNPTLSSQIWAEYSDEVQIIEIHEDQCDE